MTFLQYSLWLRFMTEEHQGAQYFLPSIVYRRGVAASSCKSREDNVNFLLGAFLRRVPAHGHATGKAKWFQSFQVGKRISLQKPAELLLGQGRPPLAGQITPHPQAAVRSGGNPRKRGMVPFLSKTISRRRCPSRSRFCK